jgi:TPR repeat protein
MVNIRAALESLQLANVREAMAGTDGGVGFMRKVRERADAGDIQAYDFLGMVLSDPERYGVKHQPVDYAEANTWLLKAAELGSKDSEFLLGIHHELGYGFPASWPMAVHFYRLAAEQGHTLAQHNYGNCLLNSWGVPNRDPAAAFPWLLKAAEGDDIKAMDTVAIMLENGHGLPAKDPAAAARWFGKINEQTGNLAAQESMVRCLAAAGLPQPREWAEHAASQRHFAEHAELPSVWLAYATTVDQGAGVRKDSFEATSWYRKAADKGDIRAQLAMGSRLEEGKGVARDPEEAASWYVKAAKQILEGDGIVVAKEPKFAASLFALAARLCSPAKRAACMAKCCAFCGATKKDLQVALQLCSACNVAKFCDRACQKSAWPAHKASCQLWRETAPAKEAEAEVEVASLPIKELKRRLDRLGISYAGVLERAELVALLENAAECD